MSTISKPTTLNAMPTPLVEAAPLIELDRARVVRGDNTVLDTLSLRIVAGQHTAILGPNGCGKSSFIKLITRELYPLAREGASPVKVLGQDRWNINALRTQLGIVTGDLTRDLLDMPELIVTEAVMTGFFASLVVPEEAEVSDSMRNRVADALALVDATALSARNVAELSTGELRRVLIARALVHRPLALLLDEPTAGLDVVAQHAFLQLLRGLAQQGITLVLVTHHLEEIIPEIDRVILLRAGKVYLDADRATALTSKNLSAVFGGAVQVRREGERYFAMHA